MHGFSQPLHQPAQLTGAATAAFGDGVHGAAAGGVQGDAGGVQGDAGGVQGDAGGVQEVGCGEGVQESELGVAVGSPCPSIIQAPPSHESSAPAPFDAARRLVAATKTKTAASKDVGATCKRVDHAGIKNVPHARLVASEHGWVRRMVIEQDGIFFDFDYTSLRIRVDPVNVKVVGDNGELDKEAK